MGSAIDAYYAAPTRFREDNGHLGQFLQSAGFSWLATFTGLRRMVDEEEVHNGILGQRFWDCALAIGRAPNGQKANVAEFAYHLLLEWLAAHSPLDEARRQAARASLQFGHENVLMDQVAPTQLQRVTPLYEEIQAQLR